MDGQYPLSREDWVGGLPLCGPFADGALIPSARVYFDYLAKVVVADSDSLCWLRSISGAFAPKGRQRKKRQCRGSFTQYQGLWRIGMLVLLKPRDPIALQQLVMVQRSRSLLRNANTRGRVLGCSTLAFAS